MQSAEFSLRFADNNGSYSLQVSNGKTEYISAKPVILTVYANTKTEQLETEYTSVTVTDYGCLATATLSSANGSSFTVEDRYYYPAELPKKALNVRRTVKVDQRAGKDLGYSTSYLFNADSSQKNLSYFVPHTVYNDFEAVGRSGAFAETELGLPMVSMMTEDGFALSLARYQPIIHPKGNYTASFEVSAQVGSARQPGLRVDYPSKLSQKYFETLSQKQIVFDLTFTGSQNTDYNNMMVKVYNHHYLLQNQRIVDTDIDQVLEVICKDYKTFMLSTNMGKDNVSYGLPWRVTIEDGLIGPKSYQSGFVWDSKFPPLIRCSFTASNTTIKKACKTV